MNRNRFIQGLKSDIQFSEKERQRIIRNSIKKYPWKLKCTVAMEEFAELQALINRMCQCIEHCATARAYSKFRENGVLVKMDDVEAGIMKSKKEKDNVKETVS